MSQPLTLDVTGHVKKGADASAIRKEGAGGDGDSKGESKKPAAVR